ncbi:MAG: outer membrane beta-barrel protein [Tannerella sp.]|jgi:TonB-dependent receptor|nr:outer membrane beta-barrel protein [Tannerella sp.]
MIKKIRLITIFIIAATRLYAQTGSIAGVISEKETGEAVIGASVVIETLQKGAVSDDEGKFQINGLQPGNYNLTVSYLSYKTVELKDVKVSSGQTTVLEIEMSEDSKILSEVVVRGSRLTNSETSMIHAQQIALNVTSGVSAQQITRTQDRDASEVVRRVPGISVIDERFVIARGLSQRYNSVWINNSAVPSSEADARSFSFDVIPGSQIENLVIVKSPSPELPADFSGGFIKVHTKNIPTENAWSVNYGMNYNTVTSFDDFKYNAGSRTDLLAFDNGHRGLKDIVPLRMDNDNSAQVDAVTKNGFNNDWQVKVGKAIPDQRFSAVVNRKMTTDNGKQWGVIASLNYSNSRRTYLNVENSRFGVYDSSHDKQTYRYRYSDDIYTNDVKLGGMLNISFAPNVANTYEFRNLFNQTGRNRYTERDGYQYISGYYKQEKNEYNYAGRMAYSGQFAGKHAFSEQKKLDWTLGISFSNRNQPDRRIIEREENGNVEDAHFGQMEVDQNEIFRDFIRLNEYMYSLSTNYSHDLEIGKITPSLKTGFYVQYRNRDYTNRTFYYRWNFNHFSNDFPYRNVIDEILKPDNYGHDKLFMYEDTDNRNSYSGDEWQPAGYVAFNIPLHPVNVYTGVRYEYHNMSIDHYTSIKEFKKKTKSYEQSNFFPSVNATWSLRPKEQLRLAYGMSVNRQEFREVSPSVYYDFELFSMIKGNPTLKPALIHNADIRYEYYPSSSELISVAFFYKHFRNPIEWTFLDAGGTYTYTFENAEAANNYGIEVDIKKNLDFIGLNNFNLTFNGSLISSKVVFGENSLEHDRPMQGQSPYLVNTGLFYQNEKLQFNAGFLYNVIGKRIIGIGQKDGSEQQSVNNDVPDLYEMPRHVIDFTFSRKFGKRIEVSAAIKDLLSQEIIYNQYPRFKDDVTGKLIERVQTAKKLTPGRNISASIKIGF